MFDPNLLRSDFNLSIVSKKLARRNFVLDINIIRKLENERKKLQVEIEFLQSEKKLKSKIIGMKKLNGENVQHLCSEVKILNNRLNIMKISIGSLKSKLQKYVSSLPNIPDDTVPSGNSKKDNLELFCWGKPKKYNFSIRDHIELGKLVGGIDFPLGSKIAGSRFVVMGGQIASLHRALSQFMIDIHVREHGYQEYYLPYLVNKNTLYGTGQLPKFSKDLFHVKYLKDTVNVYTLIPTAEVSLVNLVCDQIIEESHLPIKMVAHTPCFRAEAGTYGCESRGLIRTHQFDKVELVQIVKPEFSMEILEEITLHAEKILKLLQLPYRKVLLCAGEIGFSSCKTYDLDVWLPSHNAYCEVSSCSNAGDFQSRRMRARYRSILDKKKRLLHTLNASGLALGRTLAAVLENYQLSDGCIKIPSVLQSYMNGTTYIEPSDTFLKLRGMNR